MKQNKAQGSLEYLIIIAAVLAIAAIVVLFLTGAFKSTGRNAASCKQAASRCNVELTTSPNATCNYCVGACDSPGLTSTPDYGANATNACKKGIVNAIYSNSTA